MGRIKSSHAWTLEQIDPQTGEVLRTATGPHTDALKKIAREWRREGGPVAYVIRGGQPRRVYLCRGLTKNGKLWWRLLR